MNLYITNNKLEFDAALDHLKKEIGNLRTGRANPAMVENVSVEAYGTYSPLIQLANISVADSSTLMIEPWDKSISKSVEKALTMANLGLNIVNTGERLIAKVPPMTEENRKHMVKVLGEKVEEIKIEIRQVRDKTKTAILDAEKNKAITQDDRYKFLEELDNYVTEMNKKILEIQENKAEEIMTI